MTGKRAAGSQSRSEERARLEAEHEAFLRRRVSAVVASLLGSGAPASGPWPALEAALDALLANRRRHQANAPGSSGAEAGEVGEWQTST